MEQEAVVMTVPCWQCVVLLLDHAWVETLNRGVWASVIGVITDVDIYTHFFPSGPMHDLDVVCCTSLENSRIFWRRKL